MLWFITIFALLAHAEVIIDVGDPNTQYMQAIVNANPPGTHFIIRAGIHRMQSVYPKQGDRFTGEYGAIMSGAKVLDPINFVSDGLGRYYIDGQTQEAWTNDSVPDSIMLGYEQEVHPEDLFVDGVRWKHVSTLAECDATGEWFFDFAADRIYIFGSPVGRLVETSVARSAFIFEKDGVNPDDDISDVTVENLFVRNYANSSRPSMAIYGGERWLIQYCDVSYNHAGGISCKRGGGIVQNCRVSHNGQIGMGGGGAYQTIFRNNEICYNKELGYQWGWEGGGTKFAVGTNTLIQNNWSHHNFGPGIWCDVDNVDNTICSNLVEYNANRALFYEISYGADIYWNTVINTSETGIYLSTSTDCNVYENWVYGPINASHADRGTGAFGLHECINLKVHDNDITLDKTGEGWVYVGIGNQIGDPTCYTTKGNEYYNNIYRVNNPNTAVRWHWNDINMNKYQWQAAGNDLTGQFLDRSQPGGLPAGAIPFSYSLYGPQPTPDAPTDLSLTPVSSSLTVLKWKDNANNEFGYRIERKVGADGEFTELATVSPNVTSYPMAVLESGIYYAFRVCAFNINGDSAYTNEADTASPPVAIAQSVTTPQNTSLAITLTGTDVNGDTLTYHLASNPKNGTLSGSIPALTYTPNVGYYGTDRFTFTVNDGLFESSPAVVDISITKVNTPPVAIPQKVWASTNTAKSLTLTATDADDDPLLFAVTSAPAHGSLSGLAPNLIYVPAAGFVGEDTFTFRVSDGHFTSAPATVTIIVNTPPVATPQTVHVLTDTPRVITLGGTDAERDPLTFALPSQPSHGTLSGTAPDLVYTPTPGYLGADSFTFTVNDLRAESAPATIAITVTNVNTPPVATAQAVETVQETPLLVTLVGTDLDGDTLTAALATSPAHGALSGTAPNVTYTPAAGYFGADSFTFTVHDGQATSAPATVSITVTKANTPPTATAQSVTTQQDTAKAITLHGTDADGDALTYAMGTQPAHGTLSGTAPNVTYTPAAGYFGADSFTFTVHYGQATSAPATVSITVTKANTPPTATAQSVTTLQDTAKAITLHGTDVDGDALTYAMRTQPTHGTLSGTAPNVTYTPAAGYFGADSFTFTVHDGQATSAPATVSITVTQRNVAPTALMQNLLIPRNTATPITLAATDANGDALTYEVVSQPAYGKLTGSGATRTYTPRKNYTGADRFTFRAFDGNVYSNVAPVYLNIKTIPVLKSVTLTVNPAASSYLAGSVVQLLATPKDATDNRYLFEYSVTGGATWTRLTPDYTAAATCAWTIPDVTVTTTYTLRVTARSADGRTVVKSPLRAIVGKKRPLSVQFSVDKPSPQPTTAGPFTLLATVTGGTNVQCQFTVYYRDRTNRQRCDVVQSYAGQTSCPWTPPLAGRSYTLVLWVKDGASTHAYDQQKKITYTITR